MTGKVKHPRRNISFFSKPPPFQKGPHGNLPPKNDVKHYTFYMVDYIIRFIYFSWYFESKKS